MSRRSWDESEHPRDPDGEFRNKDGTPERWVTRISGQLGGTWHALTRGELHSIVQSGAEPVGQIHGGLMAHTQMVRHPGGHITVHKTYPAILADRPNNEVAVGLVAEAIGAPYPAVVPDPQDEHAVFLQFVEPAADWTGRGSRREYSVDLHSDDGLLLGFLDVLTVNGDRNAGNYINTEDQRVVGIDGGEAFLGGGAPKHDKDGKLRPPGLRVPGFTPRFMKMSPWLGRMEWRDNDLSPADFEAARPRLQDLRRLFQQMGMGRAHEMMMERFEAMAEHATGTERKLPV